MSALPRGPGAMLAALVLSAITVAAVAPTLLVGPLQTVVTSTGMPMDPPSAEHWLGTDELGRDILNLVIHSTRVTLLVSLLATVLSVVLGTAVGIVAGYTRGWTDAALMRVTDFFLVLPAFVLALVLAPLAIEATGNRATVLGLRPTLLVTIAVIGLTSWAGTARIVRSQTLSLRARPFVDRARVMGASHARIVLRHVLPNLIPVIAASTVLNVVAAIWIETSLSFVGLGDPFQPSWGTMLYFAQQAGAAGAGAWWYVAPPGIAVVAVVVSLYTLARAGDVHLSMRDGTST